MHKLVHFAATADDPRPTGAGVVPFRLKVEEQKAFEVVTIHRKYITGAHYRQWALDFASQ